MPDSGHRAAVPHRRRPAPRASPTPRGQGARPRADTSCVARWGTPERHRMTADLELILLGTSSPLHSSHRFGPSQIVRGGDTTVLIDCGWGATLRLYQAGLGPPGLPRVGAVFFTHLHSDHTTDFADFVTMRWLGGIDAPLPVYGPESTAIM